MKKLLLLPILFITIASLAQTKLTIQSSLKEKCAVVDNTGRDRALGDRGYWLYRVKDDSGRVDILRAFLQFDLSSIPVGSFVNWAKLSLTVAPDAESTYGPNSSLLRRITSSWDPATVTWNTQPSTTKRGTVRLPKSTRNQSIYRNIDVWTLVQAMVDSPATSFGFALKLDTEENGKKDGSIFFYSPLAQNQTLVPELSLEYTAPGLQKKVTSMSVDLSGASTEMTIYPNPCNGIFNCNIKFASTSNMNLRVIDMLGRTVYSQPVNASNEQIMVNLPSSSAGTYFVILKDNKNETIVSQELQVNW